MEPLDTKPLKKRISITIDEEVHRNIKKLAEKNSRSLSQYINIVLMHHAEYMKRKQKDGK